MNLAQKSKTMKCNVLHLIRYITAIHQGPTTYMSQVMSVLLLMLLYGLELMTNITDIKQSPTL